MSHVTDIILITMIYDGGTCVDDYPNARRFASDCNIWLEKVDDHLPASSKAFQADLFIAAINYLDIDNMITRFNAIKWEHPECVQLLLKDEHEDVFTVYKVDEIKKCDCCGHTGKPDLKECCSECGYEL